ncbi:STY0301 family protein [Rhodopila globiformis]|uniref:STY0301 family protein n=1 Tax=Rhodopila globiformis TaxID=1071 RepID=UPI0011B02E5A|nr:STY0301 family protein [Rhodopila globiformis]
MATISLLSSSVAFAAATMLAGSALAGEAGCPEVHAGAHLVTVTLYDGPPDEHADLMPDTVHESKGETRSD